ncbi:MAG: hypothetical protein ACRDL3_01025 [Solirubrobacterales bacterium]
MNERSLLAALLGFGFAAAWIGFNFGYALLCLAGAGVFYLAATYAEGALDLDQIRERVAPQRGRADRPRPASPSPRPRPRRRVQVR